MATDLCSIFISDNTTFAFPVIHDNYIVSKYFNNDLSQQEVDDYLTAHYQDWLISITLQNEASFVRDMNDHLPPDVSPMTLVHMRTENNYWEKRFPVSKTYNPPFAYSTDDYLIPSNNSRDSTTHNGMMWRWYGEIVNDAAYHRYFFREHQEVSIRVYSDDETAIGYVSVFIDRITPSFRAVLDQYFSRTYAISILFEDDNNRMVCGYLSWHCELSTYTLRLTVGNWSIDNKNNLDTPAGIISFHTFEGDQNFNPAPNAPINNAEPGTTGGTWDLVQDPVVFTPMLINTLDTGLFRVYAMTAAQVRTLGRKLWSPGFLNASSNIIQAFFDSDLLKVVAQLIELPFSVDSISDPSEVIQFDWLDWLDWGTDVKGHPLTSEYIYFNYGVLNLARYSNTFFDFEPYSSVLIYLPYVGYRPLHASEVCGGDITLDVRIHVTTGDGIYVLKSTKVGSNYEDGGNGIIATYSFNCARQLPLSQQSYEQFYRTLFTMAGMAIGAGTAFAAGELGALADSKAMAAGQAFRMSRPGNALSVVGGYFDIPYGPGTAEFQGDMHSIGSQYASEAADAYQKRDAVQTYGLNAAKFSNGIANSIPENVNMIPRAGNFSPITGRLNYHIPFFLISHPETSQPVTTENEVYGQELMGWATNLCRPLSTLWGHTEIRFIDLDVITNRGISGYSNVILEDERDELYKILYNGIYIMN